MSVKLVLLKSGEDIIADVSEMVAGDSENPRVIGYFLDKPCVVKMRNQSPIGSDSNEEQEHKLAYQVSLFPWMPLSKEVRIPIPPDWVITITTPITKLEEMYTEEVIERAKNNQNSGNDERVDFTEPD